MLTRKEFAEYFNSLEPRILPLNDDSVLWIPDNDLQIKCEYFIKTQKVPRMDKLKFWKWCNSMLDGDVRCFSSSIEDGEWWGFTDQKDIVLWTLKWT